MNALPRNSVRPLQLRRTAVTTNGVASGAKLAAKAVTSSEVADTSLTAKRLGGQRHRLGAPPSRSAGGAVVKELVLDRLYPGTTGWLVWISARAGSRSDRAGPGDAPARTDIRADATAGGRNLHCGSVGIARSSSLRSPPP